MELISCTMYSVFLVQIALLSIVIVIVNYEKGLSYTWINAVYSRLTK
jgi:hypothetical protein